MTDKTYKIIEICGVSHESYAQATRNAIATASKSVRHIHWFEVVEQRGYVKDGEVAEFQVSLKVGFQIEK